jgi:hypothetical protein
MKRTAPQPLPAPAVPSSHTSQSSQFNLLAPAALAFVLPGIEAATFSLSAASPSRAAALPLYQRNCTLLL